MVETAEQIARGPKRRRFEDFEAGQTAVLRKQITAEAVEQFARLSGDRNHLHMSDAFAAEGGFRQRVVHGVLLASYASALVGEHLPGHGSLWGQQTFRWRQPVFIGDEIELRVSITHKSEGTRAVAVKVEAVNQDGKVVMDGAGTVTMPSVAASEAADSGGAGGVIEDAGARETVPGTKAAEAKVAIVNGSGDWAAAIQAALGRAGYDAGPAGAAEEASLLVNLPRETGQGPAHGSNDTGEVWDAMQPAMEAGLKGVVESAARALPVMVARKSGVIVNVGLVEAWGPPSASQMAAAMANAALRSYTSCLARQVGPSGIRVNMISPGPSEQSAASDRQRKLQAMQTPLRRLVTPEDIANTVVLLASDGAKFITGADVPVSGGMGL